MRRISQSAVVWILLALALSIGAEAQSKCVVKPSRIIRTRPNATSANGTQQLQWYAQGVKAMQQRSTTNPNDPTGWTYQAAMHGTYTTPVKPLWNTCQHGNYFFLSWHRMYLYFFERIVRANSNAGFNLPYWDYDNPTSATDPKLQLPSQFRDTSSSLYVSERNPTMNAGGYLPVGDVGTDYSMKRIPFTCGATNWSSSFGGKLVPAPVHFASGFGALESLPHNAVHDDVGGWMSDPNTAAQDPIFWLHHSNIDRLWDAWVKLDAGRMDPTDPTYTAWLDQKFYFFDEKANQCYLTGRDILKDAAQLGYKYQSITVPVPSTKVNCPGRRLTATLTPQLVAELTQGKISLGPKPMTHQLPVKEIAPEPTPKTRKKAPAAAASHHYVISFDDIDFDKNPGVGYEVYLNLPEGTKPVPTSPYYIGTLHFFGLKHSHQESHESQLQFDATNVVNLLKQRNQWKGQINVTYVPVGPRPPKATAAAQEEHVAGTATIGKVSISQVD